MATATRLNSFLKISKETCCTNYLMRETIALETVMISGLDWREFEAKLDTSILEDNACCVVLLNSFYRSLSATIGRGAEASSCSRK